MKKFNPVTFGEHIRILREKAGLPLREVAANLNIDISLLGKIERNERLPQKKFIRQIAIFYKAEESELKKEFLSDQIACKIVEEGVGIDTLKVAEEKISYLRAKK